MNLFIGSRVNVGKIAGTDVQMVQKTDYPWKGAVAITVNPEAGKDLQRACARAEPHHHEALHHDAGSQRPEVAGRKWQAVHATHRQWLRGHHAPLGDGRHD